MIVSGEAVFKANSCSSMSSMSYTGLWWRYYDSEILMGNCATLSSGGRDRESCRLSEHNCGSVSPLYGVCFLNWKWNLPAEQLPVSQGSKCV
ncbi:uncharacterized protein TNCV_3290751 [Trichonephila clavipes]|nr:uncharacterized protein TNCV_3290751 [Trichonephila clavipes]